MANNISSTTLRPNFLFGYEIENRLNVELTGSVSFYGRSYSQQPALNTNYVRQNYGMTITNYLPLGFYLNNEFNYILNTGRADGYNQGGIVDERYNVLQSYFMLSFTYSLNKAGLKAKGGMQMKIKTLDR